MPYPLPLTRTEAYLAYKAGVIQQSDLKPSLAVPRNGIDAWLAYWTGLAADYPKREDGTPHILQEEEAYIAYLCGVINEYPEKCLRRVGAYLRYLISARWGRPDHPLNREELYLSLIKTQFIPSGDPSSDIVIDGTAKAPFVDVKMYGNTTQQTYTGKNFINSNIPPVTSSARTTISQVDNGIEVVRKNTSQTGAGYATVPIQNIDRLLGQVVSYSFNVDGDRASDAMALYGYKNGVVSNTRIRGFSNTSGSFTMPASLPTGEDGYCLCFYVETGEDKKATFTNMQLELGSTVSSYEPYVGGTASPNPDYPQAVQTVTGEQTIEIIGKNLFDKNNPNILDRYYFDGSATTSAIVQAPLNPRNLLLWMPCLPSTTYSITVSSEGNISQIRVGETAVEPAEGVAVTTIGTIGPSLKLENITTSSQANYLVIRLQTNIGYSAIDMVDSVFGPMQIELGSIATTYAPYSKQTLPINLGKNLLNVEDNLKTSASGLDFSFSDNKLVVSGTPTATYANVTNKIDVDLPAGDYTLSISNAVNHRVYLYVDYEDSTTDSLCVVNAGSTSRTATFAKRAVKIRLDFSYMTTGTALNESFSIQLEKGSTATPYAPYFTPIELCKIGDYQDYIYKDDGEWKIHKATAKIVLNGSENIELNTSSTNTTRVAMWNILTPSQSTFQPDVMLPLSDHFMSSFIWNEDKEGLYCQIRSIVFRANKSTIGTTEQSVKSWLVSNNVSVYYALATATETTITDANLIAQLEALVNGGAEDGTTYIKVNANDPNLPGLLYVEAPKYD